MQIKIHCGITAGQRIISNCSFQVLGLNYATQLDYASVNEDT